MTEQGKHWKKDLKMKGVAKRLTKIKGLLEQLRDLEASEANKKMENLERALAAKNISSTTSE